MGEQVGHIEFVDQVFGALQACVYGRDQQENTGFGVVAGRDTRKIELMMPP